MTSARSASNAEAEYELIVIGAVPSCSTISEVWLRPLETYVRPNGAGDPKKPKHPHRTPIRK